MTCLKPEDIDLHQKLKGAPLNEGLPLCLIKCYKYYWLQNVLQSEIWMSIKNKSLTTRRTGFKVGRCI